MQQPRPQRLPGIWSVTWKRPLGVGEPGAPIETRRRKTTRPSLAQRQQPLREVRLDAEGQPADVDRRRPRHPADDAVAEHVALHREPVAAPLDDPEAAHRAERRLPRRDGQRPAGRGTADRDLRAPVDHERQRPVGRAAQARPARRARRRRPCPRGERSAARASNGVRHREQPVEPTRGRSVLCRPSSIRHRRGPRGWGTIGAKSARLHLDGGRRRTPGSTSLPPE